MHQVTKFQILANIGSEIRKAREKRNLTQIQLAEKLGTKTHTAICSIESGNRVISTKLLADICNALDVDIQFKIKLNAKSSH